MKNYKSVKLMQKIKEQLVKDALQLHKEIFSGLVAVGLVLLPFAAEAGNSVITKTSLGIIGRDVTSAGAVHDIYADKVSGAVAINRFKEFDLAKNEIVNLYFKTNPQSALEANKLVNFVDNKISIAGTVNGIRNSKISGHMYFISSKGILVSESGVINAGALSVIVPTNNAYNNMVLENLFGTSGQDITDKFDSEIIALNPTGTIAIKGKINTTNGINLKAANVQVGDKYTDSDNVEHITIAQLQTGITNFTDLVNIKDASGNVVSDANLQLKSNNDGTLTLDTVNITAERATVKALELKGQLITSGNLEIDGPLSSSENVTLKIDGALNATGTITADKSAALKASGDITLNKVTANEDIVIESTNGSITANNLDPVNISLNANDKISVQEAYASNVISMNSVNGDIEIGKLVANSAEISAAKGKVQYTDIDVKLESKINNGGIEISITPKTIVAPDNGNTSPSGNNNQQSVIDDIINNIVDVVTGKDKEVSKNDIYLDPKFDTEYKRYEQTIVSAVQEQELNGKNTELIYHNNLFAEDNEQKLEVSKDGTAIVGANKSMKASVEEKEKH